MKKIIKIIGNSIDFANSTVVNKPSLAAYRSSIFKKNCIFYYLTVIVCLRQFGDMCFISVNDKLHK